MLFLIIQNIFTVEVVLHNIHHYIFMIITNIQPRLDMSSSLCPTGFLSNSSRFSFCSQSRFIIHFWKNLFFLLHAAGYEKTEDASEKTSLADQEDSRLIHLNQPQFTKFCSNRVR